MDRKEYLKKYKKEYYINNNDKLKEHMKKYYIDNLQKIKTNSLNYYHQNKEKIKARQNAYFKEVYYKENLEKYPRRLRKITAINIFIFT